jgi:hypothetical protein
VDDPHALPAAAGRRLDHQRVADLVAGACHLVAVVVEVGGELGARHERHAGVGHPPLGLDLVAHRLDRVGVGPIQVRPASVTARAKAAFSARNP